MTCIYPKCDCFESQGIILHVKPSESMCPRTPPGRRRYLAWPQLEEVRQDTLARQRAAMGEIDKERAAGRDHIAGRARDRKPAARDSDYPKPGGK